MDAEPLLAAEVDTEMPEGIGDFDFGAYAEGPLSNSDWIGLHLQVRYLSCRVDVVWFWSGERAVHEMLCRFFRIGFDNRMLQLKKQMRWVDDGFDAVIRCYTRSL